MTRRAGPGERGFVLIGVIMFVLALTIIGLSLFSVSGYEAQFLQRSIDSESAYHAAMGGIERAKFVLAATSRLERVGQGLPFEDVVGAEAIQRKPAGYVAAGDVDWIPDEPITLRVTAQVQGQRRTIEARFLPMQSQSLYRQAITVSGGMTVDRENNPRPLAPSLRIGTVLFDGQSSVWDAAISDTTEWLDPLGQRPRIPILTAGVPAPDVATYFVNHPPDLATPAVYKPAQQRYELSNAGSEQVAYYCAPPGSAPEAYFRDPTGNPEIWVKGVVVWEFPRGVRFDNHVVVRRWGGMASGLGSCLVIVAGACGTPLPADEDSADAAMRFFGGIEVENDAVSVVLVSSGNVYLQHMHQPTERTNLLDLAIYSARVHLTGPETATAGRMTLAHAEDGPLNVVYLDRFKGVHALPGVHAGSDRTFAFVPGTWRALEESWRSMDR